MQYVPLGRTGLKVSRLCLGCMNYGDPSWRGWSWLFDEAQSRPYLRGAWEAGINFFDTADSYSDGASEAILGRFLREDGIPRDQVVIGSKVYGITGATPNERGLSRKHIRHAVEASLRRLQTDYIDLYQIHRFDPATPIAETLEALDLLVRAGKVLHIGASSMAAWQFQSMLHQSERRGLARFATMQNHYNLLYREEEREMMPLCRAEGIAVNPWSPLARGFLARGRDEQDQGDPDRHRHDHIAKSMYFRDGDFDVTDRVALVAQRRGVPMAQVALAWLLHQPGVASPVVGTSRPHHLGDAVAALDLVLDGEEIRLLEEPYQPHPVLGHA